MVTRGQRSRLLPFALATVLTMMLVPLTVVALADTGTDPARWYFHGRASMEVDTYAAAAAADNEAATAGRAPEGADLALGFPSNHKATAEVGSATTMVDPVAGAAAFPTFELPAAAFSATSPTMALTSLCVSLGLPAESATGSSSSATPTLSPIPIQYVLKARIVRPGAADPNSALRYTVISELSFMAFSEGGRFTAHASVTPSSGTKTNVARAGDALILYHVEDNGYTIVFEYDASLPSFVIPNATREQCAAAGASPLATGSASGTPSGSPSDTATATISPTASPTASATASSSATATPSTSASTSPTPTAEATVSASASAAATSSASPTGSASPSALPSVDPSTAASAGSGFVGLTEPSRVFDSRGTGQPLRAGPTTVDLSGVIPAGARAAVLNVTALRGTNPGHVTVYPAGSTRPETSNVNFDRATSTSAAAQANEVISLLPADRRIVVDVGSGTTPAARAALLVDVIGFLTDSPAGGAGRLDARPAQRVYDSELSEQPRRSGETVVTLEDIGSATGVVLNVTINGPSRRGHAVVFPTGTSRPQTSNINFEAGQTQANEVITRLGAGNRVSVFLDGRIPPSARVIVDLVGLIGPHQARGYVPLERSVRALDTRSAAHSPNGSVGRRTGAVTFTLPASVPAGARAVWLNVTATGADRAGHITAYPAGARHPGTSNVNFRAGGSQANQVLVGVGSDRRVTLHVDGRDAPHAHVIADVSGYL